MRIELEELGNLSHLRTDDGEARRRYVEDEDLVISDHQPYRQDADTKIGPSKASRQLQFKTQVVSSPQNGLIRNRASHTMEVVSIATMIADILGLNVDLVRAMSMGHDGGHVPFGHVGEKFLSSCLGKEFRHEVFGVIRLQRIERLGKGVNATHQTLSGILYHSRGNGEMNSVRQMSAEASVTMIADKIGFITSDYNDLVKRRLLPEDETRNVTELINQLGRYQRERVNRLIMAICRESILAGRG